MIPHILILCFIIGFLTILYSLKGAISGFANASQEETDYNSLKAALKTKMESYCIIASIINEQLKNGYMSPKPTKGGTQIPGESNEEADKHLIKAYTEVYTCSDSMSSSRSSCPDKNAASYNLVPCSAYMELPDYDASDTSTPAITLASIANSTPNRIKMEVEWFTQIIQTLQKAMAGVENPSSVKPPEDSTAVPIDSFTDAGKCSPEAMKLLALEQEAAGCSVPILANEIPRVSAILDSEVLKSALAKCNTMKADALKLKEQLDKLKSGKMFGSHGTSKDYATFKGGDRAAALAFSMKQNQ